MGSPSIESRCVEATSSSAVEMLRTPSPTLRPWDEFVAVAAVAVGQRGAEHYSLQHYSRILQVEAAAWYRESKRNGEKGIACPPLSLNPPKPTSQLFFKISSAARRAPRKGEERSISRSRFPIPLPPAPKHCREALIATPPCK